MSDPQFYNGIRLPDIVGGGTREQHIAMCKVRALEYLPDDIDNAVRSMTNDLMAHPETAGHPAIIGLTQRQFLLGLAGERPTPDMVRTWIEAVE